MIENNSFSPEITAKIDAHRRFWDGEGSSLIFIPRGETSLYDMTDYPARFETPRLMFEFEADRARAIHDWPTDGIPTVRPSLGTIFIPAIAGQNYQINADQMPWPGNRLPREEILGLKVRDLAVTPMYSKAREFYDLARSHGDIVAYHGDTQGVFDLAHILYGEEIFLEMAMEEHERWVQDLLDICLSLYIRVSNHLKADIGEESGEMIHGHGTPQGLFFPRAGVRISEDSATLLSPGMIERFLAPVMEKSMEPYSGGFVHFCGRHEFLFEWLCRNSLVRAIDLGNPEMYDLDFLARVAGETGTVLYTRVAALDEEDWESYVRRVAGAMSANSTRCVLRPLIYPTTRPECQAMLDMWHEYTS